MFSSLSQENSKLRSLHIFGDQGLDKRSDDHKRNLQAHMNIDIICKNFKLLRVLDINGAKTSNGVMPKELGNLIHLRYLRIKSTNIRVLPNSIGKLRNLLTLDYWNVTVDNNGIRLPNVLWKLKHLRHMYLPYEMSNIKDDFKIVGMNELRTLWGVRGGNWMLKQMPNLSSKLTKLCIQGISRSEQMDSLLTSPVIMIHDNLSSLDLEWYSFSLDAQKLEVLCGKCSLNKLRLKGNVLDQSSPLRLPSNLRKLELYYTRLQKHESLKAIGELRGLKFLRLAEDSFVGMKWIVDSEEFPMLEGLKMSNLWSMQEWEIESSAMQCLTKLSIVSCVTLNRLPKGLMSIATLERLNIKDMPINFNKRIRSVKRSGGEDFELIKHVPSIKIQNSSMQRSFQK